MDRILANQDLIRRIVHRRRLLAILKVQALRRNKRRWWVRPINQNRQQQGDWDNLIKEIRQFDEEKFFEYTRLSIIQFDKLLSLVEDKLTKCNKYRKAIPARARLAITLRFLAAGGLLSSIAFAFRIGKSTACNIISETCNVLWTVLQPQYLPFPIIEEWKAISNQFHYQWNLPHCMGAIDGKHCVIQAPCNSGSQYFNYKKTFSIVLFAVCDANYIFTYVDIGAYGSQSDGGVLKASEFGKMLFANELQIPTEESLPDTNIPFPYFFEGDEAFPLHKNILRPYGGKNLDKEQRIFNYRLSRARRCIENAFGIMVSRFRIFHQVINASPDTVDAIIKACVCLHNFIKITDSEMRRKYSPSGYEDSYDNSGELVPGGWRNYMPPNSALANVRTLKRRIGTRNVTTNAANLRNVYNSYVNSPTGSVPWQNSL